MITISRSIIFNVAGAPVFEDGLEGKNFLHNKNHSVSMIGKSNNVHQRTSKSSRTRALISMIRQKQLHARQRAPAHILFLSRARAHPILTLRRR